MIFHIGRIMVLLSLLTMAWVLVIALITGPDPAPFPLNVLFVVIVSGGTLMMLGGTYE